MAQVVLAYRYTSITSVMLLDCFAIPCAMLLSHLVFRSRWV
jgi:solute carrier family 35, member F1/2